MLVLTITTAVGGFVAAVLILRHFVTRPLKGMVQMLAENTESPRLAASGAALGPDSVAWGEGACGAGELHASQQSEPQARAA